MTSQTKTLTDADTALTACTECGDVADGTLTFNGAVICPNCYPECHECGTQLVEPGTCPECGWSDEVGRNISAEKVAAVKGEIAEVTEQAIQCARAGWSQEDVRAFLGPLGESIFLSLVFDLGTGAAS